MPSLETDTVDGVEPPASPRFSTCPPARRMGPSSPAVSSSFLGKPSGGLYDSRIRKKLKTRSSQDDSDDDDPPMPMPSTPKQAPSPHGGLLASYAAEKSRVQSKEMTGSASSTQLGATPSTPQTPSASSVDPGAADDSLPKETDRPHTHKSTHGFFDITTCSWVNVAPVVQRAIHSVNDRSHRVEDQLLLMRNDVARIQQNIHKTQELQVTQLEGLRVAIAEVGQAMAGSRRRRRKQLAKVLGNIAPMAAPGAKVCKCRNGFQASADHPAGEEPHCVVCGGASPPPLMKRKGSEKRVSRPVIRVDGPEKKLSLQTGRTPSKLPAQISHEAECSSDECSASSEELTSDQVQQVMKLQDNVNRLQASIGLLAERCDNSQFKMVAMESKLLDLTALLDKDSFETRCKDHVWAGMLDSFPKYLKMMGAIEQDDLDTVREFLKEAKSGARTVREDLTNAFEIIFEELLLRIEDIEQEVSELFDEDEFSIHGHGEHHAEKRNTDLMERWRRVAKKAERRLSGEAVVEEQPNSPSSASTHRMLQACLSRASRRASDTSRRNSQELISSRRSSLLSLMSQNSGEFDRGGTSPLGVGKARGSLDRRKSLKARRSSQLWRMSLEDAAAGDSFSSTLPSEAKGRSQEQRRMSREEVKDHQLPKSGRRRSGEGSSLESSQAGQNATRVGSSTVATPPDDEDLDPESQAELKAAAEEVVLKSQSLEAQKKQKMSVPQVSVACHREEHHPPALPSPLQLPMLSEEASPRNLNAKDSGSPRNLSVDDARSPKSSSRRLSSAPGTPRKDRSRSSSFDRSPSPDRRHSKERGGTASGRNSPRGSLSPSSSRHKLLLPSGSLGTSRIIEGSREGSLDASPLQSLPGSCKSSPGPSNRPSRSASPTRYFDDDFPTELRSPKRQLTAGQAGSRFAARLSARPLSKTLELGSPHHSTMRHSTMGIPGESHDQRKSVRPKITTALNTMDEKFAQQGIEIRRLKEQTRSHGEQVRKHDRSLESLENSTKEKFERIEAELQLKITTASATAEQDLIRQGMLEIDRRLEKVTQEFHDCRSAMFTQLSDDLQSVLNDTLDQTVQQFEAECERINTMARIVFPRARKEDRANCFSASEARWYVLDSRLASAEERLAQIENREVEQHHTIMHRESAPAGTGTDGARRGRQERRTRAESQAQVAPTSKLRHIISDKMNAKGLKGSALTRANTRQELENKNATVNSFADAILAAARAQSGSPSPSPAKEESKSLADVMLKAAKAAKARKASPSPGQEESRSLASVALAAATERKASPPPLQDSEGFADASATLAKVKGRFMSAKKSAPKQEAQEVQPRQRRTTLRRHFEEPGSTPQVQQQVLAISEAGESASDAEEESEADPASEQEGSPELEAQAGSPSADPEGTSSRDYSPERASPGSDTDARRELSPAALTPASLRLPTHNLRDEAAAAAAEAAEAAEAAKRTKAVEAALAEAQKFLGRVRGEAEQQRAGAGERSQRQQSGSARGELEPRCTPPPLSSVPIHSSGSTLPVVGGTAQTTGSMFHCVEGGDEPFSAIDRTVGGTVLGSGRHKDLDRQHLAAGLHSKSPGSTAAASAAARGLASSTRPHSAAARGGNVRQRPAVPRGLVPTGAKATFSSNPWESMRIEVEPDWQDT